VRNIAIITLFIKIIYSLLDKTSIFTIFFMEQHGFLLKNLLFEEIKQCLRRFIPKDFGKLAFFFYQAIQIL